MGRILQAIAVLILFAVLGTLGYAYFGDMAPRPVESRHEVALPGNAPSGGTGGN